MLNPLLIKCSPVADPPSPPPSYEFKERLKAPATNTAHISIPRPSAIDSGVEINFSFQIQFGQHWPARDISVEAG
jgi:hypothetical protein